MYQDYKMLIVSLACCVFSSCFGGGAGFREKKGEFDPRDSLKPILDNAIAYRAFYGRRGFVQGGCSYIRVEIHDTKSLYDRFIDLKIDDEHSDDLSVINRFMEEHIKLNAYLEESGESWIPSSFIPIALYFSARNGTRFLLGRSTNEGENAKVYVFVTR